jgi:putative CocE/NonD family hydrolase
MSRRYLSFDVKVFASLLLGVALLGVSVDAAGQTAPSPASPAPATAPNVSFREVMIPMRDGTSLHTVIMAPKDQKGPLPIIFRRTPYGIPDKAPNQFRRSVRTLLEDGYIYAIQSLRGRFKSEGRFVMFPAVDPANPGSVYEATDAYDSIDWLVKNVPMNNGKVGMFGTSYDGLAAGLTLLAPHPALKAIAELAAPADEWMNDDLHRYGALRLSYAFDFTVYTELDKQANSYFPYPIWDTYEWFLKLGPLSNVNRHHFHGKLPMWNLIVTHPDYDQLWKSKAWYKHISSTSVPTLNVAGFWDPEDPWGPWQIFRRQSLKDPGGNSLMVAGPWNHGAWHASSWESIGPMKFGGHDTAKEYSEEIERPFFRYWLHDKGTKPAWKVKTFQTGSNQWRTYPSWPPIGARTTALYLHANGTLSFNPPGSGEAGARQYVSDPANPVPYRRRPISPTYPGGDWPDWEADDQRFVDGRPDVLTYVSAPLEADMVVSGDISARLFASTSGTDSDFIVKLIDVFPEDAEKPRWPAAQGAGAGEYAASLNGYQFPIAMEVRRGRYLRSFERPGPLVPGRPTEWIVPLRDRDHVFRKGHRIMVQVQSTWFPLIDRNPQKFVPSIYAAKPQDFRKAVQRVHSTPAMASRILLPVVGR